MKHTTVKLSEEGKVGDNVFKKNKIVIIKQSYENKATLKPIKRNKKGVNFPREIGSEYLFKGAWKIENPFIQKKFWRIAEDVGNVCKLWHGSDRMAGPNIALEGMLVGRSGMFGGGIYFGEFEKASLYKTSEGAHLIYCRVALGEIYKAPRAMTHLNYHEVFHMGYNSVQGVKGSTNSWGGTLSYDEWVIYSQHQVLPMYIGVYDRKSYERHDNWLSFFPRAPRYNQYSQSPSPSGRPEYSCAKCHKELDPTIDITITGWKNNGSCVSVNCSECDMNTTFDLRMSSAWRTKLALTGGPHLFGGRRPKKKKKKTKKAGRKRK